MKQNVFPDKLFSGEGDEIVTVEQAKQHIKIPSDIITDDGLIGDTIKAARKRIESYCGVSLIARTVVLYGYIQDPPCELPFGPVATVTSVLDDNGDDVSYTLTGVNFKKIHTDYCKPITVEFETGGLNDEEWQQYVLRQVAWLYENKGDVAADRLEPGLARELSGKRRHL